jgi:hypothetical protein
VGHHADELDVGATVQAIGERFGLRHRQGTEARHAGVELEVDSDSAPCCDRLKELEESGAPRHRVGSGADRYREIATIERTEDQDRHMRFVSAQLGGLLRGCDGQPFSSTDQGRARYGPTP